MTEETTSNEPLLNPDQEKEISHIAYFASLGDLYDFYKEFQERTQPSKEEVTYLAAREMALW